MSERGMSEVVTERRSFAEILVQHKCTCNYSCDLSDLESMRHPRSVMLVHRKKKHLSFMHQTAEGLRMKYPVTVTLKLRPVRAWLAICIASACI